VSVEYLTNTELPQALQREHNAKTPKPLQLPTLPSRNGSSSSTRTGITLVEYLRNSVAWGGFPGHSFNSVKTSPGPRAAHVPPEF
jgi:hypothetical protein